jgi:hypothetical protein
MSNDRLESVASELERPSSGPGWHSDPGHWFAYRFWDGQRWSGSIASSVVPPGPAGQIEEPSIGRSRGVFVILALAIVGLYLILVAVNSALFGYSFWSDPTPSRTAETFVVRSIFAFFLAVAFAVAVAGAWWSLSLAPSEPQRLRRSLTIALHAFGHSIPALLLTMLSLACVPVRVVRWLRLPRASRSPLFEARTSAGGRRMLRKQFVLYLLAIQMARLLATLDLLGLHESFRLLVTNGPGWLGAALAVNAIVLTRLAGRAHVREALSVALRPANQTPSNML